MIHKIQIDMSDQVIGANQRNLLGLGQVAEIEKAEFAEPHQDAGGTRIFRRIQIPLRLAGAIGIRPRLHAGN